MPKRIVDGEALWTSEKLAQIQPEKFRAEYANWIPLAEVNGAFEASPRLIWHRVYSFNRPDITVDTVQEILNEFTRVKLVTTWNADGKAWGYFNGIEKPGRLPASSQLLRGDYVNKNGVPDPPPLVNTRQPLVENKASQISTNTGIGIGRGKGLGREIGRGEIEKPSFSSLARDSANAWQILRKRFRNIVKRSQSPLWENDERKFAELVNRYGEDAVISAIESWIEESVDYLKKNKKAGIGLFFKDSKKMTARIEEAVEALSDPGEFKK